VFTADVARGRPLAEVELELEGGRPRRVCLPVDGHLLAGIARHLDEQVDGIGPVSLLVFPESTLARVVVEAGIAGLLRDPGQEPLDDGIGLVLALFQPLGQDDQAGVYPEVAGAPLKSDSYSHILSHLHVSPYQQRPLWSNSSHPQ
jgi:hypothetical protein